MRRISSRWTVFYKRVFPIIWFGGLLLFIAASLFAHSGRTPGVPFVVFPIVMMIFGFFIMRKLVFDLVDEVWDDTDSLVIKSRGQEQRVALADIKNVNYSAYSNPPRVTLSLRRPTLFGGNVTFAPPVRFVSFATSPIIDDLIERVDAARRRHD